MVYSPASSPFRAVHETPLDSATSTNWTVPTAAAAAGRRWPVWAAPTSVGDDSGGGEQPPADNSAPQPNIRRQSQLHFGISVVAIGQPTAVKSLSENAAAGNRFPRPPRPVSGRRKLSPREAPSPASGP